MLNELVQQECNLNYAFKSWREEFPEIFYVEETIGDKSKCAMVLVSLGSFNMGTLYKYSNATNSAYSPHKVTLTKDFWMGTYAVTQTLWESVMGSNPSHFKGANRPVENVSWFDVVEFCNNLSNHEGLEPAYTINGKNVTCNWSAKGYRLPTEAEWEYSARANQDFVYAGSDDVNDIAWHDGNSGKKTHPVGQKSPNAFGLYDMSGNIREWVWDRFGDYTSGSHTDPTGPDSGPSRVSRGGDWSNDARFSRVSFRFYYDPTYRSSGLGFRLVRTL